MWKENEQPPFLSKQNSQQPPFIPKQTYTTLNKMTYVKRVLERKNERFEQGCLSQTEWYCEVKELSMCRAWMIFITCGIRMEMDPTILVVNLSIKLSNSLNYQS